MKNLFLLLLFFSSVVSGYNAMHLDSWQQTKKCLACDFNLLDAQPQSLHETDLSDSNISGSYFYGSSLAHLNLSRITAREINGVGVLFHDNDLTEADFSYSDLPQLKITHWNRGDRMQFMGAFLMGSDFSYTRLIAPNFFEAHLKNASLYRVDWPQANLSGANLQSADLSFAKLYQANLEGAQLSGAVLSHADLSGANLFNSHLTPDQIKQTKSVCGAILPDGRLGGCK